MSDKTAPGMHPILVNANKQAVIYGCPHLERPIQGTPLYKLDDDILLQLCPTCQAVIESTVLRGVISDAVATVHRGTL